MSSSPDSPLHRLAQAVGLAAAWKDVHGRCRAVADETLEALLNAMGLECGNGVRVECSLRRLHEEALHDEGRMIVVEADQPIVFEHDGSTRYRLEYESGAGGREGHAQHAEKGGARLEPVSVTGYHQLSIGGRRLILAVTPRACVPPSGAHQAGAPWGLAAQVYSLHRRPGRVDDAMLENARAAGDYGALEQLALSAGQQGASALAISPVHALFSADPSRYSPYAPSSRLFLNTAYIDVAALGEDALCAALASLSSAERNAVTTPSAQGSALLIDWPAVQHARMAIARQLFSQFESNAAPGVRQAFDAFWRRGGEALQNHCLYEALHAHYAATLGAQSGWQDWPAPMRDPAAAAAQAFARQHGHVLRFHAFLQWLADEGMRKAQHAAKAGGMAIGLITDLAIGTDARGSQAWSAQQSFLRGATVGAAPDLYYSEGQDWGLTAFSPRALRASGFGPFLATLRSALTHAGGVRIDHVLGLARMWLVPQGMSATQGAFLRYPLADLLGLLALESQRHRAVVVGENLGTVPPGFDAQLQEKGVLGTSVLWFERDDTPTRGFKPVHKWPAWSMATTTTHDLPTVAGWWQAKDIDWLQRLGRIDSQAGEAARARREHDKRLLARAASAQVSVEDKAPVARIIGWVASGPASLCVFPMEDILALTEQPNLPGSGPALGPSHPNWLRLLPMDVNHLLLGSTAQKALDEIRAVRGRQ